MGLRDGTLAGDDSEALAAATDFFSIALITPPGRESADQQRSVAQGGDPAQGRFSDYNPSMLLDWPEKQP